MRILILAIVFILSSCKQKGIDTDNSVSIADSLKIYLDFANQDALGRTKQIESADRAFRLVQMFPNDSNNRVNVFKVANRYYNINDLKNYKVVSREALSRAQDGKDTASIAKAYLYLGDFYRDISSRDSAYAFYSKAEKIYFINRAYPELTKIKLRKATVLWNQNDYFGSEAFALEALRYMRGTENQQDKYEALMLLGIISNAQEDYSKALDYLGKALEIAEQTNLGNLTPIATTLNNVGNVYQNIGDNSLALQNFNKAIKTPNLKNENPALYAILLDNVAYSKFKLNFPENDIVDLFKHSLRIKDSLGLVAGIIFSKTRIGEFYHFKGDLPNAIKYTSQALQIAKESKNSINELAPLKQLSEYDSQNSKIFSQQYIKINDSVQHAERKIKDKFARIQFETEEISLKNNRLETKNRNLVLFFVGTVMIGLLLFVIRTQRAKNRELLLKQAQQKANEDIYNLMLSQQNKIEEGRIREKKRIAQELHDGVLSRLFGARLNLDSLNKSDGDEARDKRINYLTELKNIEQDIREISHDLNREKFVLINNFVAILTNLLEEQGNNFETEVETEISEDIPWDKIGNTLKINIYRIVQEALQNVNKYAKASKVKVKLVSDGTNLRLEVTDNGQGFSVDKKAKGIGLSNMVSRTQECDGQLEIKSKKGKGTTISILFPTESKSNNEQTAIAGEPVIA